MRVEVEVEVAVGEVDILGCGHVGGVKEGAIFGGRELALL